MEQVNIFIPSEFPPLDKFPSWAPPALIGAVFNLSKTLATGEALQGGFEALGVSEAQLNVASSFDPDRMEATYAILCDIFAYLCTAPTMEKVWKSLKRRINKALKIESNDDAFNAIALLIGGAIAELLFSPSESYSLTRDQATEKIDEIKRQIMELSQNLRDFGIGTNTSLLFTDAEMLALYNFISSDTKNPIGELTQHQLMILPGPPLYEILDRCQILINSENIKGSPSTRNIVVNHFARSLVGIFKDMFDQPLSENVAIIVSLFFPDQVWTADRVEKLIK